MNDYWLATRRCLIGRKGQITLSGNVGITPSLIVPVQSMDFPACIALSRPLGDVEPGRSSTVETPYVDSGEVVLFSWVLDEFVRGTKARQVSCRRQREAPLND